MENSHKNGRWASEIIALQKDEGHWGYFHTLSNPSKRQPIATEQALRRLKVLGFTKDDAVIAKALGYMLECLAGRREIPDRKEKLHNWELFTKLMLSTWVRMFTHDEPLANQTAGKWKCVAEKAFASGNYDHVSYLDTYRDVFGIKPDGGRLVDFVSFYQVSLLTGEIAPQIEKAYFDYILDNPNGIYYICGRQVSRPHAVFKSLEASRYLAAVEMLCAYRNGYCRKRLEPVKKWLEENGEPGGGWDMGPQAKDGINFPLSDSWRSADVKKRDCTERIRKIIAELSK